MYYTVKLSDNADQDIDNLSDAIIYTYQAPNTAFKYVQGLLNAIQSLSKNPESPPIQTRTSLQQYGANVRRINYKKMAIIYTVHGNIVYIHRIIAGSMITGL